MSTAATSTDAQVGRDRSDPRPRRVAPSALALLESARHGLAAAEGEASAGARYVSAHLAALRAAAEAGLPRAVSPREADDLLRDAETFLSLAEEALGVAAQAALPLRSVG